MNDLLSLLKKGEMQAFHLLYETYYDSLLLYATQILHDPEAASDVVQERLIDLWENKRYNSIHSALNQYLYAAIKRAALNYLRDAQCRTRYHQKAISADLSEENTETEIQWDSMLYKAIDTLPEERRRIFKLIALDGLKYQEVADLLGLSINTIKKQMGRAFKHLRDNFEGQFHSILLFLLPGKFPDPCQRS